MVKSLLPLHADQIQTELNMDAGIVDPRTLPPELRNAQRMQNIELRVGTGAKTPENYERAAGVEMDTFPDVGTGMFIPDLPTAIRNRG